MACPHLLPPYASFLYCHFIPTMGALPSTSFWSLASVITVTLFPETGD